MWLHLNAELAPVPFLFQQLLLSAGAERSKMSLTFNLTVLVGRVTAGLLHLQQKEVRETDRAQESEFGEWGECHDKT